MQTPIDYMTVVEPVLEVTLIGKSDYALWESLIRQQGLPFNPTQQHLTLVISAVQARYMGKQFRECSLSIQLDTQQFYLAHAFNSVRFFAFAERKLFRTPYYFAEIAVSEHHISIRQHGQEAFRATLPADAPLIRQGHEANEWQIWLPETLRKSPAQPHYFHARLEGHSRYFEPSGVQSQFGQSAPFDLLHDFQLTDWLVRSQAKHSKSQTMYRTT